MNRAAEYIKKHKKEAAALFVSLIGICLIIFGGADGNSRKSPGTDDSVGYYTEYLEKKIADTVKSIGGIDEAYVLLTLDSSSEYVYGNNTSSDYIILEKGEEAVLLHEIYPTVRGIAVVCTGGELPRIRETVSELISAATGVPISKIKVAGC